MKIAVKDINPSLAVNVTGQEPWLADLYKQFAVKEGPSPLLKAQLRLQLEEGGSVSVTGSLAYAPFLPCGRCERPLAWSLELDVEARFLPEEVNPSPREKNLSKADLDAYYLEQRAVNLEQLLIDTVHEGLPSRLLATSDDGASCRVCHADLSSDIVYGQGAETDKPSPFAALKGLKLPN